MYINIETGELVKVSTQLHRENVKKISTILLDELNRRFTYWFEIHPDDLPPSMKDLSEDDLWSLGRFYEELISELETIKE